MATARIVGKDEARAKALASIAAMERTFGDRIIATIHETDHMLKTLTPVNTGEAVRNYIWTVGEASVVSYKAIDNGPPGPTNSMALGSEPRRRPNEDAASESLAGLNLTNPFQKFILTNNSQDIAGLELGILPGPPFKSRSPNGMFGVTQLYITAKIETKGMLK